MYVEGRWTGLGLLRAETIKPSIVLQGSGKEVPSIVVVERVVDFMSDVLMSSIFTTDGSIIVMLAWSSSIARP